MPTPSLPRLLLVEFSGLLNVSPTWNGTVLGFSSLLHLTSLILSILTQNGSNWVWVRTVDRLIADILVPFCGLESARGSRRVPGFLNPPLGKAWMLGHRPPCESRVV